MPAGRRRRRGQCCRAEIVDSGVWLRLRLRLWSQSQCLDYEAVPMTVSVHHTSLELSFSKRSRLCALPLTSESTETEI